MGRLRTPFFIIALILLFLAFFLQIGANSLAKFLAHFIDPEIISHTDQATVPPGLGIRYMALFDSLLLYTVSLIGISIFLPDALHARFQGLSTLVLSLVVLITSIVLIFVALVKLVIMVSLLFAPIFGTWAYFSLFASFPTNASRTVLAGIMALKIGFAAFLLFAHERFLENRSLVFLTLVSLLLGVLVSFFHGIVPVFLVSITDAIAAIIVGIIALIWALKYLFGSITSISRLIS
jgi:hypothetical protein